MSINSLLNTPKPRTNEPMRVSICQSNCHPPEWTKALDENKDNTTRKSKGKVTAIAHGGKSSSVNTSTTRDRPRLVGLFRSRITSNSIFGRKLRERSAGRGGGESVKNYFWQFHGAIKPLVVLLLPFIRTCLSELTGTIVQKPFQN